MTRWLELEVRADPALAEGMAGILAEVAGGLVESREGGTPVFRAYLPLDDQVEARVARVRARVRALQEAGLAGEAELVLRQSPDQEWENAWKAHFKRERIAPNLVIVPSWEQYQPAAGEAVVVIDPGMAFGTGQHATTRGCLRALARLVRPGMRVMDVGTGSGILAIAAARLGAQAVLALEVDRSAAEVARENVARNGVADRVQVAVSDLTEAAGGACVDLVVANIVAEAVVALVPLLGPHLQPGGWLVASGIVKDREPLVRAAMEEHGFAVEDARREGEWVTLIARRAGQGRGACASDAS